jgi:hypothetical protein
MYVTKRYGFAMILAIFVVILVSLGGVLMLNNVTIGSKGISNKYFHTQAELLAMSATEFAVMRAQGFNTTLGSCLKNVNISIQDASGASAYDANVTIRYSFKGSAPAGCNDDNITTLAQDTNNSTIMLIDVTVTSNPNANLSTEDIRVHKRSWQKL